MKYNSENKTWSTLYDLHTADWTRQYRDHTDHTDHTILCTVDLLLAPAEDNICPFYCFSTCVLKDMQTLGGGSIPKVTAIMK